MSLGLIPVFLGDAPAALAPLGEVLADAFETLEQLAADAALTPLSAFSDQRPLPDDFDGSPEELDVLLGPCTDWFEASDGADALARMSELIGGRATASFQLDDREALLDELSALKSCLDEAGTTGTKFRFEMA